MSNWVFCNRCFQPPRKTTCFSLTNCGHVYCNTCLGKAHHAMEEMEEFVYKVWEGRWRVIPYDVLSDWLKDNDYLLHDHRSPIPSFRACFKSIFHVHSETGDF
ncbi:Adiponectin receptor protein 1 [Tupaia chinensis]|uniref:Adiponectin receptor protein 1 n=1 Tax=Tupaia chinensis TaxID=246437 RepID=L9KIH7_TUPCH|nr:Adiponectin receptor protein 1 [Tupaia chinensis]